MGGYPPLGYDVEDKKLVVNEEEATRVRYILRRYIELGSVFSLMDVLKAEGVVSKLRTSQAGRKSGGLPFQRGALYHLLQNRIYLGDIVHKHESYPGKHKAIVERPLWDEVQAKLIENKAERRLGKGAKESSLLAGLIFDDQGNRMTPSHAVKKGKRYRYYVSRSLVTGRRADAPAGRRVPAAEVEGLVSERIRETLLDENTVLKTIAARTIDPAEQKRQLERVREIANAWSDLEPDELRCILMAIIVRVDVMPERVDIQIHLAALAYLGMDDIPTYPATDSPTVTLSVSARLKRAGMEIRMIVEGARGKDRKSKPDRSLVRLILTAQTYQDLVLKVRGQTLKDLADQVGVTRSYFTRALRLAYLAPDIVRSILVGAQPPELTAAKLKAASRLPLTWAEQRELLGFNQAA